MKNAPSHPMFPEVNILIGEIDDLISLITKPLFTKKHIEITIKKAYDNYKSHIDKLLTSGEALNAEELYAAGNGVAAHGILLIQLFKQSKDFNKKYTPIIQDAQELLNKLRGTIDKIQVPLGQNRKKAQVKQRIQADESPGAYILTWDPDRTNLLETLETIKSEQTPPYVFNWSVGGTDIPKGSRIYIMRQDATLPGLIGTGETLSNVYERDHWDKSKPKGTKENYADIQWDDISTTPVIPLDMLEKELDMKDFWMQHGTGLPVPQSKAVLLFSLWMEKISDAIFNTDDPLSGTSSSQMGSEVDLKRKNESGDDLEDTFDEVIQDLIIGYSADGPSADDRLGVFGDVRWLSSIIIAKDWSPPLSIGLFGDWGSGKSSFMLMMQKEIRRLVGFSKQVAIDNTAYVRNIAQVRINAWHCMDTNLWANLAIQILEGISLSVFNSLPNNENKPEDIHQKLLSQLAITKKQIDRLETDRKAVLSNIAHEKDKYVKKKKTPTP